MCQSLDCASCNTLGGTLSLILLICYGADVVVASRMYLTVVSRRTLEPFSSDRLLGSSHREFCAHFHRLYVCGRHTRARSWDMLMEFSVITDTLSFSRRTSWRVTRRRFFVTRIGCFLACPCKSCFMYSQLADSNSSPLCCRILAICCIRSKMNMLTKLTCICVGVEVEIG